MTRKHFELFAKMLKNIPSTALRKNWFRCSRMKMRDLMKQFSAKPQIVKSMQKASLPNRLLA
jgi:hypothetical protein